MFASSHFRRKVCRHLISSHDAQLSTRLTARTAQIHSSKRNLTCQQPAASYGYREEEDMSELRLEDNGDYAVILPDDPLAQPSQRVPARSVPSHIRLPPYVPTRDLKQRIRQMRESVLPRSSIIPLGGEEEQKLRRAARLAERTLAFAGTLVKVGPDHTLPCHVETKLCRKVSPQTILMRRYTSLYYPTTRIRRPYYTRGSQSRVVQV
jgi:hypothetical protein